MALMIYSVSYGVGLLGNRHSVNGFKNASCLERENFNQSNQIREWLTDVP